MALHVLGRLLPWGGGVGALGARRLQLVRCPVPPPTFVAARAPSSRYAHDPGATLLLVCLSTTRVARLRACACACACASVL